MVKIQKQHQTASPGLDVGTILQPKCLKYLIFANDDYEVTDLATPIIVGVLSNDSSFLCSINRSSLLISTPPINGTVTLNADGTITYTPNVGFSGIDTFQYSICSNEYNTACDIATVKINVTNCNAVTSENLISGKIFIEQLPDDGTYDVVNDTDGNYAPTVGVNLYADINCNKIIDAGENIVSTTKTDLSGNYNFSVLSGYSAKDDFDLSPTPISGNDGGINFSSNWLEFGIANGFATSPVTIGTDATTGNNALIINGGINQNIGAQRNVTFSGATEAILKFSFRRQGFNNTNQNLTVYINKGTAKETILYRIEDGDNLGTDSYYTNLSIFIPASAYNANGGNTFSFIANANTKASNYFYIDNVDVTFATTQACFIANVDPSNTNGKFIASSLNSKPIVVSGLGNCYKDNNLGLLAQLTAVNDIVNVIMDFPKTINVLANDIGNPDINTVTIVSGPTTGTASINADGTILYTPAAAYNGADAFQYKVCSKDDPSVCSIATVNLNIACTSIANQNTVLGLLYDDANNSGTKEGSETGLSGVTVELYTDTNNNGVLDLGEPLSLSKASIANGTYQFDIVPPQITNTVLDQFNTNGIATGNNGTNNWSSSWQEIIEADGFNLGSVLVSNNNLRVTGATKGAFRTANLTNAISATLSFNFTNVTLSAGQAINVEVQKSGGSYTSVGTLTSANSGLISYDISAYISNITSIRFVRQGANGADNGGTFDNVQISYKTYSPAKYIVKLAQPITAGLYLTTTPTFYPVSFLGSDAAYCSANFGLTTFTDLSIIKTVNNAAPYVGNNVIFTLTAHNAGPSNATLVKVADLLPAGYIFVSATPSASYNSGSGLWTIGNLASGASTSLTITAKVNATGPYANTAIISGKDFDSNTANNTSTATTAPINVIVATNDSGSSVNGFVGGTSFSNVLSNDRINGALLNASEVTTTFVSSTNPGISLSGTNIIVAAGTPAGNYTLIYSICENINGTNCSTAVVTVPVTAAPIDAVNEIGISIDGSIGGTSFTNVLSNDTLNGVLVNASQVTTTFVSSTNSGITLSGTNVVVAAGTPSGNYTLTYRICENLNTSNCDTATVSVVVLPPDVTIADASVSEGGNLIFTVSLHNPSIETLVVRLNFTNVTTSNSDYTTTPVTVTFSAGQISVNATVPTTNDTIDESDETFTVSISPVTGASRVYFRYGNRNDYR